jgi:hypothetical protein
MLNTIASVPPRSKGLYLANGCKPYLNYLNLNLMTTKRDNAWQRIGHTSYDHLRGCRGLFNCKYTPQPITASWNNHHEGRKVRRNTLALTHGSHHPAALPQQTHLKLFTSTIAIDTFAIVQS